MPTSIAGRAGKRRKAEPEREFIRGNRDGTRRANETYTVCRIGVSQKRLDEEMQLGLHSHFVSADLCWDCPGHMFVKAQKKHLRRLGGAQDQGKYSAPSAVDLKRWQKSGQDKGGVETLEIVQRDLRPSGDSTYTICRVGVPRLTMVREVESGLHPGYHVRTGKRGRYVQGNPTRPFDNVNYPDSETPGLAARELCPYRLLRPGSRL